MSRQTERTLGDFARDLKSDGFRNEMRSSWSTAVLFRPPAVVLAWVCSIIGLSPFAITAIALALALSLPAQALWLPAVAAPVAVFLSGVLYQVLDCTDGTLARATGRTTQIGADLDFLIDMAQWGLLYLAIGILADRCAGGGWGWTALAAAAGWTRLMARVVRDRLAAQIVNDPEPMRVGEYPAAFLAGISGLIPVLALCGGWLGVAVVALLVYGLLDIAEGLAPLLSRKR